MPEAIARAPGKQELLPALEHLDTRLLRMSSWMSAIGMNSHGTGMPRTGGHHA